MYLLILIFIDPRGWFSYVFININININIY